MKKLLKILFVLVISICLLLVGVVVYVTQFINPNDYKTEIKKFAEQEFNLHVDIKGNIDWSFFPWIGFSINQVTINPPDTEKFADIEHAEASLSLMALLSKKINVRGILLDGLQLHLIKDNTGKANWDFFTRSQKSSATQDAPENENEASTDMKFTVAKITVKNSTVTFENQQTHKHYAIQLAELNTHNLQLQGEPFLLHLNGELTSKDPDIQSILDLSMTLRIDSENKIYEGHDVTLKTTLKNLFAQEVVATLKSAITLNQKQHTLTINNLSGSIANAKLQGSLEINALDKMPHVNGTITTSTFNARKLLEQLGKSDTLASLASTALQEVSLSTVINSQSQTINFSDLKIVIDDTTLNGQAAYQKDKQKIRFDLVADTLNLDKLLAEKKQGGPAEITHERESTKTEDNAIFPVESLRKLNLTGNLQLKKLVVSTLEITDFRLTLDADQGVINASDVQANLFEGTFRATLGLNVTSATPTLTSNISLHHLQISPLLVQFAKKDLMSGVLDLEGSFHSSGNTNKALKANLKGKVNFNVTDGILNDIDLAKEVCQGIAKIRQESLQEKTWENQTPFETLQGDFVITNGKLNHSPVMVKTKSLDVGGSGVIDLNTNALDYHLDVVILGDAADPACKVDERFEDVPWPIHCKGVFSDSPSKWCLPDLANMEKVLLKIGENELKQKLNEKLEEELNKNLDEKTKEKIGEKIKEFGLDKLFGK